MWSMSAFLLLDSDTIHHSRVVSVALVVLTGL